MHLLKWKEARPYYTKLLDESKWSKPLYAYHLAAVMCMEQETLTDENRKEQAEMMR